MGFTLKWLTDLGEPPDMTDKCKMMFYSDFMKSALQKVLDWQQRWAEQKHKRLCLFHKRTKKEDMKANTAWETH